MKPINNVVYAVSQPKNQFVSIAIDILQFVSPIFSIQLHNIRYIITISHPTIQKKQMKVSMDPPQTCNHITDINETFLNLSEPIKNQITSKYDQGDKLVKDQFYIFHPNIQILIALLYATLVWKKDKPILPLSKTQQPTIEKMSLKWNSEKSIYLASAFSKKNKKEELINNNNWLLLQQIREQHNLQQLKPQIIKQIKSLNIQLTIQINQQMEQQCQQQQHSQQPQNNRIIILGADCQFVLVILSYEGECPSISTASRSKDVEGQEIQSLLSSQSSCEKKPRSPQYSQIEATSTKQVLTWVEIVCCVVTFLILLTP